ncbi:MAG: CRISPR-associated endonuclease Cas1 [Bacillota bacterium]
MEDLLITNYGSFLGKKSERAVVKENGKVVVEAPFHDLRQITVNTNGATLSTDFIKECMQHGITINFLSSTGKPYAKLISPGLTGTVQTRRAQLRAYDDERGFALAKNFVEGKLHNQANVLKYFAKYRKGADRQAYEEISRIVLKIEDGLKELAGIKGKRVDDVRGQVMSVEGRAGNHYWEGIKILTCDRIVFPGREHRGAADPVNSLLNYGYGMLYQQAETALILAGLDPFGGFLHVDRSGKESLVYDFVEEFRQQVVDRVVVALINKGFLIKMEDGMLTVETRRQFAEKINERLESQERYQGRRHKLRTIVQSQARRVATFLRGEAGYKPFVGGW